MPVQFIDGAQHFYKMYSMWAFLLLGSLPELYNLAIQTGLLTADEAPAALSKIIALVSFAGAASRLIKQKQLEVQLTQATEAKQSSAVSE